MFQMPRKVDEATKVEIQRTVVDCLADTCVPMTAVEGMLPAFRKIWELGGGNRTEFDRIGLGRKTLRRFLIKQRDDYLTKFKSVASTLARAGKTLERVLF